MDLRIFVLVWRGGETHSLYTLQTVWNEEKNKPLLIRLIVSRAQLINALRIRGWFFVSICLLKFYIPFWTTYKQPICTHCLSAGLHLIYHLHTKVQYLCLVNIRPFEMSPTHSYLIVSYTQFNRFETFGKKTNETLDFLISMPQVKGVFSYYSYLIKYMRNILNDSSHVM